MQQFCFSINNYTVAIEVISVCKKLKKIPVLHIKYFIINGFGINWLKELNQLIKLKYQSKDFKFFINSKTNYGLFINLVEYGVDYINIRSDEDTMKKLKQIAKINKVSVNPKFSIIDLKKIKRVDLKIKKIYE